MELNEKIFFQNHAEFLRTHRGKISFTNDTFTVESDREAFTFAIPEAVADVRELARHFNTFYLTRTSLKFEKELSSLGFSNGQSLNYMTIKAASCDWKTNDGVRVKQATSEKEFEDFSEVQARGFCDTEEEYKEWHPWLRVANFRNINNSSQIFYTGYSENKPVGVALAVYLEELAGMYAVTTLPAFRKKGISTTIMKQLINDAAAKGYETITLQVVHGSYAEFFYQKLGFKSAFLMKIFSKDNSEKS